MRQIWQWQEAKSEFSQIFDQAIQHSPQIVIKDGVKIAVVMSAVEYRRLLASQKNIVDFFQESPLVGLEFDLSRDKSEARIDLAL